MHLKTFTAWTVAAIASLVPLVLCAQLEGPSVAANGSVQEAIDRNPGKMVFVPPGDYRISSALRLKTDDSGLWGPGRIIQTNPEAEIIVLEKLHHVRLEDVTFTRAEGSMETHRPGIDIVRCSDVTLENVQVRDNRGNLASIFAAYCTGLQIKDSLVLNYSRIAIDDRTAIPGFGWAFTAIDGHGIMVRHSTGTRIEGNRIVEQKMLPTRELKEKYHLGEFVKQNAHPGPQTDAITWQRRYFNAWHQGAAVQITKGETSDYVQILGNYIENAAQGLDIHGDHVIVAYNIIQNARSGMKAVHGARNVIIVGNQFSHDDLWSILIRPGSASHSMLTPDEIKTSDPADPEARTWPVQRPGANIDGHSIIANNIISDFGYGTSHWIWAAEAGGSTPIGAVPIQFTNSPTPERSPPETDVIVSGNMIYDPGRDGILVDGKPTIEPPRYQYAVKLGTGPNAPRGIHFNNNIFNPGTKGLSNVELTP